MQRRMLIKGLASAALVVGNFAIRRALSAELPRLDPKDPAARALGYVEDAKKTDVKKIPTYAEGSNCENCLLLQGSSGAAYRPCNLFPGKVVAVAGWCSGWTAEI
jgi:hypothetical protein